MRGVLVFVVLGGVGWCLALKAEEPCQPISEWRRWRRDVWVFWEQSCGGVGWGLLSVWEDPGCQRTWGWQTWLPLTATLPDRPWCAKMDISTARVSLASSPRLSACMPTQTAQYLVLGTAGIRRLPRCHLAAVLVSSGPFWRETRRLCVFLYQEKTPNKSLQNFNVWCQRDRQPSAGWIDECLLIIH